MEPIEIAAALIFLGSIFLVNTGWIDSVLAAWSGEAFFDPGACTRGLYLRGVE